MTDGYLSCLSMSVQCCRSDQRGVECVMAHSAVVSVVFTSTAAILAQTLCSVTTPPEAMAYDNAAKAATSHTLSLRSRP